jgi:hypothetical protein
MGRNIWIGRSRCQAVHANTRHPAASPPRNLLFSPFLSLGQDTRASDVPSIDVLSIRVPSSLDDANVRVHDTIAETE